MAAQGVNATVDAICYATLGVAIIFLLMFILNHDDRIKALEDAASKPPAAKEEK